MGRRAGAAEHTRSHTLLPHEEPAFPTHLARATPLSRLHCARRIFSNGDSGDALVIADADASAGVVLAQDGNSWASLSDERAKAGWRPFGDALAKLRALDKVGTYARVDVATQRRLSGRRLVGLSAQEVKRILPEAVVEGGDGLLSLKYQDLFVLGLQATQEIEAENAAAKAELAAAKEKLAAAEAATAASEAELAAIRSDQAARDEALAALAREVAALRARDAAT